MTSRATWTFDRNPPARAIGLVDRIGGVVGRRGPFRSLSMQRILDRARRKTGLSDWGDERFLESMEVLVDSLERDVRPTPFGRLVLGNYVSYLVENRLRMERFVAEHPQIEDLPIRRPLFVVGLPRTGTTLLYNLLAQGVGARPLRTWETYFAAPFEEDRAPGADTRPQRTRRRIKVLDVAAPQLADIHPVDPDGIEECNWLMATTFVSPSFRFFGELPTYFDWLDAQPEDRRVHAYREYRRQLQALWWQRGGAHWVLKSPIHLEALDALLEVFPDACIVRTHRDPNKVLPSSCSLHAVLQRIYAHVDPRALGPAMVTAHARQLERAAAAHAQHADRILDVQYRDLVADPRGTVGRIHAHFGYEHDDVTDRRMHQWMSDRPHRSSHRYGLEQFGLSEGVMEQAFRGYREAYDVPREGGAKA